MVVGGYTFQNYHIGTLHVLYVNWAEYLMSNFTHLSDLLLLCMLHRATILDCCFEWISVDPEIGEIMFVVGDDETTDAWTTLLTYGSLGTLALTVGVLACGHWMSDWAAA